MGVRGARLGISRQPSAVGCYFGVERIWGRLGGKAVDRRARKEGEMEGKVKPG